MVEPAAPPGASEGAMRGLDCSHFRPTVRAALLAANRRELSLVDVSGFHVMNTLGIRTAFAFDAHFKEYGFELVV